MNHENWKRVVTLMLALLFVCLYAESHVNNDFKMVRIIRKQRDKISLLKSYIKMLEKGKHKKWKRCI
jgi:hypothetical protein